MRHTSLIGNSAGVGTGRHGIFSFINPMSSHRFHCSNPLSLVMLTPRRVPTFCRQAIVSPINVPHHPNPSMPCPSFGFPAMHSFSSAFLLNCYHFCHGEHEKGAASIIITNAHDFGSGVTSTGLEKTTESKALASAAHRFTNW